MDDHPAAAVAPTDVLSPRDAEAPKEERRHKNGKKEKKEKRHKHKDHKHRHKEPLSSTGGEAKPDVPAADGAEEGAEEGELLEPPLPSEPSPDAAAAAPARGEREDQLAARPRAGSRSPPPPRRDRSSDRRRERSPARSRQRSRSAERHARRDRSRERPGRGGYEVDRSRNGRVGVGFDRRYDARRRSPPPEDRHRRSRSRSRGRSKWGRSEERERTREQRKDPDEEDDEAFQARVAAALEGQAGAEDEDRLIEERRRRRQEILAKHRQQQQLAETAAAPTATSQRQAAVAEGAAPPVAAEATARPASAEAPEQASGAAGTEADADVALSDGEDAAVAELGTEAGGALDIWRHGADAAAAAAAAAAGPGGAAGIPAAASVPASGIGEADDEELQRRLHAHEAPAAGPGAAAEEEEEEDIFAATPEGAKRAGAQPAGGAAAAAGAGAPAGRPRGLVDNYDDAEGYYVFQVGEIVGERYEVFATHGRGVFSSVLRARDLSAAPAAGAAAPEVAIKVIRSNDTMYKAGLTERVILRKLAEADPQGRRHVIRMLGSFEYRHHLCLVFEPMDMNLRELTKRYGRGIGLSLSAVRIYAQQMLVALHHLRNCGVIHADVKPDNILVNDRRTLVKICDFGSAMFSGDNEITPYLVSRFYRAPEIVMGLPYDHPLDMWSIGCVVYELATGRILFPGKTNNEMLKLMMDLKGPFPKKMIKKGEFCPRHFESDPNMSFALLEEDKVTRRPVRRLIPNPTVRRDFGALLAGQSPDRRKLAQLADLLERMMALDPERRLTPKEALRHPFVKEAPGAAAGGGKEAAG